MSTIRKHHNLTPQPNPRHREKELWNTNSHKALARQLKENNQPSPPQQDDNKYCIAEQSQNTEPTQTNILHRIGCC